jgi:hypothetical protein
MAVAVTFYYAATTKVSAAWTDKGSEKIAIGQLAYAYASICSGKKLGKSRGSDVVLNSGHADNADLIKSARQ